MPKPGPLSATRTAMGRCALVAICLLSLALPARAEVERVWSQERIAIGADGQPMSPVRVRAEHLSGLHGHSFPLSDRASLLVQTNVVEARARGVEELGRSVARAWAFVNERLGIAPRGDVLLYLIEVDEVPLAYRFEAQGTLTSRFGEVRLAWIPSGAPLWGEKMPESLSELVFDTLPHEFVHDQLDQLPQLEQELSRGPSPGTRWFVEGLCEMVAKEFCREESPSTWARMIRMRRLDHSGRLLSSVDDLLTWSQEGSPLQRESDLYGASMLLVRVWARSTDPRELMHSLRVAEGGVDGERLIRWLQAQLECDGEEMLDLAQAEARWVLAEVENQEARASKRAGLLAR